MSARFVGSQDGTRIAYEAEGAGPAILLLHGGGAGHSRRSWYDSGYVPRLTNDFKVIAMDIRGEGQSDRPLESSAYSVEKHCQDIAAVISNCGVGDYTLWGFSYGANIARYLAAWSTRVSKLIVMGIPFGPGAAGQFRESIIKYRDRYLPFVERMDSLSDADRSKLEEHGVPLKLASFGAMLDWPSVDPVDVLCPTLWLVGSKNEVAMASVTEYSTNLERSRVQVHIVDGLDHEQEFTEIDQVFPIVRSFLEA
jgi:pimeloyl-ACP methyl ester carboxylesterase